MDHTTPGLTNNRHNAMGCDIHAFIEQKHEHLAGYYFRCFAEVNLPRDYRVFGSLAGVRREDIEHIEPRGVPRELSWDAENAFTLRVNDSCSEQDGFCSQADAQLWVKQGTSYWFDDAHTIVSHPDWHSASWLTADEFEAALSRVPEVGEEYIATLQAMKALPNSRLVFWFDN